MGGVDHVRAGDAGKEVFRAARETNYFVWESWTENEDMVIFKHSFVNANIDFIRQRRMPILPSNLFDFILLDHTEGSQRCGRIPRMIQQSNVLECGGSLFSRDSDKFMKTLFI